MSALLRIRTNRWAPLAGAVVALLATVLVAVMGDRGDGPGSGGLAASQPAVVLSPIAQRPPRILPRVTLPAPTPTSTSPRASYNSESQQSATPDTPSSPAGDVVDGVVGAVNGLTGTVGGVVGAVGAAVGGVTGVVGPLTSGLLDTTSEVLEGTTSLLLGGGESKGLVQSVLTVVENLLSSLLGRSPEASPSP